MPSMWENLEQGIRQTDIKSLSASCSHCKSIFALRTNHKGLGFDLTEAYFLNDVQKHIWQCKEKMEKLAILKTIMDKLHNEKKA